MTGRRESYVLETDGSDKRYVYIIDSDAGDNGDGRVEMSVQIDDNGLVTLGRGVCLRFDVGMVKALRRALARVEGAWYEGEGDGL